MKRENDGVIADYFGGYEEYSVGSLGDLVQIDRERIAASYFPYLSSA